MSSISNFVVEYAKRRDPGHAFVLFDGSAPRGSVRPGSDIDIAVNGHGSMLRKYANTALESIDPAFHAELNAVFKASITTRNIHGLHELAKRVLDEMGGELTDGYKALLPEFRLAVPAEVLNKA